MRAIFRTLSLLIAVYACLVALSGTIGFAGGDPQAGGYLILSVIFGLVAAGLLLAAPPTFVALSRAQLLALLGLVWLFISLMAAIPVYLSTRASLIDSLFEAVSALTTTGASVLDAPERLPLSFVMCRALTAWYGGALTFVSLLMVLARVGAGGLGGSGPTADGAGRPAEIARQSAARQTELVLKVYAVLSLVLFVVLALSGLPLTDALVLAAGTISATGYEPRTSPLSAYVPPAGLIALLVAMVLASTSWLWLLLLVQRRFALAVGHLETKATLAIMVSLAISIMLLAPAIPGVDQPAERAFASFFAAVSLVSTTGLETHRGIIAALPAGAVALIVVVGGSSFSLTGGIKLFRVGAMGAQAIRELQRLVHPHSVDTDRFGSRVYSLPLMRTIWTLMAVWLIVFIGVGLVIAHAMPSFAAAYSAALAVTANAGPIYPAGIAEGTGWPAYRDLGDPAKLALIGAMVAGRLEILALAALLLLPFWRR
jgi:trk system potassium uptake protein